MRLPSRTRMGLPKAARIFANAALVAWASDSTASSTFRRFRSNLRISVTQISRIQSIYLTDSTPAPSFDPCSSRACGRSWRVQVTSKGKIGTLVADGFQEEEYFLPKAALQRAGFEVEVISIQREPVEIYSFFNPTGKLDVHKTIDDAKPEDYVCV